MIRLALVSGDISNETMPWKRNIGSVASRFIMLVDSSLPGVSAVRGGGGPCEHTGVHGVHVWGGQRLMSSMPLHQIWIGLLFGLDGLTDWPLSPSNPPVSAPLVLQARTAVHWDSPHVYTASTPPTELSPTVRYLVRQGSHSVHPEVECPPPLCFKESVSYISYSIWTPWLLTGR